MNKYIVLKSFSTIDKNLLIIEGEIIYGEKTHRYDGMLLYLPDTRQYVGNIIHPDDFLKEIN